MLKTVVVTGHICLDIFPDLSSMPAGEFKTVFEPGSLIEIGPAALSTGGPVSNTGLALHRLGILTRLMAKIGQDHLGQIVLDLIKSYDPRLAEGMVSDASTSTSYSVIISPHNL
jgi:sugar/nucleoside kinase (ribokinase family)